MAVSTVVNKLDSVLLQELSEACDVLTEKKDNTGNTDWTQKTHNMH